MQNPLAIALRKSRTPEQMYARTFAHFQSIFNSHPQTDVRRSNILAHDLPEGLRGDRRLMGMTMTGAIVAMLDHETQCGMDVPARLYSQLDEIIIEQGSVTGVALLTSDLVLSRISQWERTDYRKFKRWLKSLDKAARIHQQRTAAPLDDPYLPEIKRLAVEELRPVVKRMQERFSKERLLPGKELDDKKLEKEIVEAFAQETQNPDLPFLSHEHNHELLLRFYRRDPVAYWHLSPERLFDAFTAFVSMHEDPEYVRKKFSALKKAGAK